MIRVIKVNGMNKPEQRAGVVYVGRAWAGWPESPWCNPYPSTRHKDALTRFRLDTARREDLDEWLAKLWEATEHGKKPLGCWCVNATAGDGQPIVCHAQVLAEYLAERFGGS